ncbi:unnamed protein product [Ectocarpus sp. CCAP 1310/34]|nr:unnamed protein product [Ectocarpus sp. CCAP 1310/34]
MGSPSAGQRPDAAVTRAVYNPPLPGGTAQGGAANHVFCAGGYVNFMEKTTKVWLHHANLMWDCKHSSARHVETQHARAHAAAMIRNTIAGVDSLLHRSAAAATSAARQGASSRGLGDRQQHASAAVAVCWRGCPTRRLWSSQEAEEKDGAGDAAANVGDYAPDATATTEEPAPPKPQRTFVVRTPDSSSSLKVNVPSTTAEAMAMNLSIRENARAKKEAAARRHAATTAARASSKQPGGEAPAASASAPHSRGRPAERRRLPSMMVVTPNARSKSIQMEVPLTTAECIELNRAVKKRYPTQQQEADEDNNNNAVNAGYARRWRNPPAPGVCVGQGAQHAYGAGLSSSPEIIKYADVEQGAREPSYDRTIGNLHKARRWDQIVRVWEEIEEREKGGVTVGLGWATYECLMDAFISHTDLGVVARCGRVFDHLVASGQGIRPAIYNLYMKGCSVARLGTRAVALIEGLDRLPGKRYKPNPQFFFNLLSATCAEGMVAESKLYYGIMRDMGFDPTNNTLQNMLDMYIREERLVDALRMVEDTHQAGMKPRDVLMNKLTYSCMRQGEPELMHKMLDLLLLTGNIVNPMTVKNVLYMASRRRDDDMATKMWVAAQQWGHRFCQADYSFVVQTFFAVGKDDMALATLVQAYKEKIEVNRKTLTFCAQRLAVSNKRLDQAYYTLTLLKENGEPVPVEAVNAIIVACAIRQAVDRCFATAEALPVVFELAPNLDTYNALMHVLGAMRAQDTDNATLGIGMSLLDQIEKEEVQPNQETFMSLIDLACMSDGLTEDFANDLVERMTSKHGLRLEQDIVDTLASAFEERGMDSLAQAWTNKMPSLDAPSDEAFDASSPAAAAELTCEQGNASGGVVRARRVAQDRGRYTGFDDGRFKAIRDSTRRGENAGGGVGRLSYGSAGGGGGGWYSGGGGAGGSARGGRGTSGATAGSGREERVGNGGDSPRYGGGGGGGWAQRYNKSGDEK